MFCLGLVYNYKVVGYCSINMGIGSCYMLEWGIGCYLSLWFNMSSILYIFWEVLCELGSEWLVCGLWVWYIC